MEALHIQLLINGRSVILGGMEPEGSALVRAAINAYCEARIREALGESYDLVTATVTSVEIPSPTSTAADVRIRLSIADGHEDLGPRVTAAILGNARSGTDPVGG